MGLEPAIPESESGVLPLHQEAIYITGPSGYDPESVVLETTMLSIYTTDLYGGHATARISFIVTPSIILSAKRLSMLGMASPLIHL